MNVPHLPSGGNAHSAFYNTSNCTAVAGWLRLFLEPNQVVELRAIRQDKEIEAGFFDYEQLEGMAHSAIELSESGRYKGLYFIFNPIKPDLLKRAAYTVKEFSELKEHGGLTKDEDILRRRWLLIDADPRREGTCSASAEEKDKARAKVLEVRTCLSEQGWPEPILADSGNGFHLMYRIDLPAEDGGLIRKVLHALAEKFDDQAVQIDRLVFNPARLTKLYGTWSRKGGNTTERPHRLAEIIAIPAEVKPVPTDLLEQLAAQAPIDPGSDQPVAVADSSEPSTSLVPLDQRLRQARAYLVKVPGAIEGKQGDKQTYRAARILVTDFSLTPEEAWPLFLEWNKTCRPPWPEPKLRRKLEKANEKPGNRGRLLDHPTQQQPPEKVGSGSGDCLFLGVVPDFMIGDARWVPSPQVRAKDRSGRPNQHTELSHAWYMEIVRMLVVQTHSNDISVPDVLLGQLLWGPREKNPWGRNWRRTVSATFHPRQTPRPEDEGVEPTEKARRTRKANKENPEPAACGRGCPLYGRTSLRHRHREWVIHDRFLGVLAQFICNRSSNGRADFDFTNRMTIEEAVARKAELRQEIKARKANFDTYVSNDPDKETEARAELRQAIVEYKGCCPGARKVRGVRALYLPVRIFGPSPLSGLSYSECNVLSALTMEITRSGKSKRKDKAYVVGIDTDLPSLKGRRIPVYPALPAGKFVAFNGNGKGKRAWLRGYGYKIERWMTKAGYPEGSKPATFLAALAGLQAPFGLVAVGYHPETKEWKTLEEMIALSGSNAGREWLKVCLLRIYTRADYLVRWRQYFAEKLGFSSIPGGEEDKAAATPSCQTPTIRSANELQVYMKERGLTDGQMAAELGTKRETINRYRQGRRKWKAAFQKKLDAYLARDKASHQVTRRGSSVTLKSPDAGQV